MNRALLRALRATTALCLGLVVGACVAGSPSEGITQSSLPSPAAAEAMLAGLTIAPEGSISGYSREQFPHWTTVSGTCNTREWVLRRDGVGVQTDSDCYPTSGSWPSPYDGATWTNPSDVDIDHVVPLAEAWRSGASGWTTARRSSFANDLDNPQLIAVTDNVNQAKGDQSPDQWKPPMTSYWCIYASMWIDVKHTWDLTATDAEVAALGNMLASC